MVKPHWYNEGMRDAFCVALHVTDFDAIGYRALTVWESGFLSSTWRIAGVVMEGGGVSAVADSAQFSPTAFLLYVPPLKASPAESSRLDKLPSFRERKSSKPWAIV